MVFPRARVACFVDGCWWHGHEHAAPDGHGTNGVWWKAKLRRNRERDIETDERLVADGWTVVRIWECEDAAVAALRIAAAVRSSLSAHPNTTHSLLRRSSGHRTVGGASPSCEGP
jgi:DNA mismatch endonuclease, patch repair protein